jgi:hypothetical protein
MIYLQKCIFLFFYKISYPNEEVNCGVFPFNRDSLDPQAMQGILAEGKDPYS